MDLEFLLDPCHFCFQFGFGLDNTGAELFNLNAGLLPIGEKDKQSLVISVFKRRVSEGQHFITIEPNL